MIRPIRRRDPCRPGRLQYRCQFIEFPGRNVVLERQLECAERHRRTERERSLSLGLLPLHPDAISTLQIDDEARLAFGANLRVEADTLLSSSTMSLRLSADADRLPCETDLVLDFIALENDEFRHGYLFRVPVCLVAADEDRRTSRAIAPEIAESIRPAMRFPHVVGALSVTVSSLSNDGTGRKSTVSSVADGPDSPDPAGVAVGMALPGHWPTPSLIVADGRVRAFTLSHAKVCRSSDGLIPRLPLFRERLHDQAHSRAALPTERRGGPRSDLWKRVSRSLAGNGFRPSAEIEHATERKRCRICRRCRRRACSGDM